MNATEASVTQDLAWFKSSYSGAEGGECVEVASAADGIRIRDSKDPAGPVLTVRREAWAEFVDKLPGER